MDPKPGTSKSGGKTAINPLIQNVGKLAAGVASVNTIAGGSATGTTRNKHALQPGHSLMDWIRLGSSGKDLTGIGSQAGRISVTPSELALHDQPNDAWICIRGRVYNVTPYLSFHPGGPDELLRAIGKESTTLFDEVHPWVNFEQILNKCYIGPFRSLNMELTSDEIFGDYSITTTDSSITNVQSSQSMIKDSDEKTDVTTTYVTTTTDESFALPKFDWMQKMEYITLIFYTGPFSNAQIELIEPTNQQIDIFLTYNGYIFENTFQLFKEVEWPADVKLMNETGKVEIVFKKVESEIWDNFGVLKQSAKEHVQLNETKFRCTIIEKRKVNHNTFLFKLERNDNNKIFVPLGKHITVYDTIKGKKGSYPLGCTRLKWRFKWRSEEVVRCYTPVPSCLFAEFRPHSATESSICLMVKRYPKGNMSKMLTNAEIGDFVTISKPMGSFQLATLDNRETFIILAAGTGITPMLALILFLLERRIRKCQHLRLLFFNQTEEDIVFRSDLEALEEEGRFKLVNILSKASAAWHGIRGKVTRTILDETLSQHLSGTTYVKKDVYFLICGPTGFSYLARDYLEEMGISEEQSHYFLG